MDEKIDKAGPPLVRAALRGDAASFRQLVEKHQKPVYNLCLRYVGASDAEDVAQEAFIRAFVHKDKFDPKRSVLPWLLTVARNLCIDKLREKKPLISFDVSASDAASNELFPDEILSEKQQLFLLTQLLQSLPEGQREAVMLTDVEELSYRETADVLQVPLGTVMTWLHRGRARLRDLFIKRQKTSLAKGVEP